MNIFEKFTPKDKRKITKDWQKLIPSLGIHKSMQLINRVGPIVVGITLKQGRGSTHYIPIYYVHNLCRSFPGITLTLTVEIGDFVEPSNHDEIYKDLANLMVEKAFIPFDGDVHIDTIIKAYEKYFSNPNLGNYTEYEDLVLICGWCGDRSKIDYALNVVKGALKEWPEERYFKEEGGFDNWFKKLEKQAYERENLREICEQEVVKLKLEKMPVRQLIY